MLSGQALRALLGQYSDPTAEHTVHSLNVLCVRLVFCLYADGNGSQWIVFLRFM